jgi:2-octaprenyl-6-methoxyphenol hydroxylase
MVGASLACALVGSDLRIGVIEAVPLRSQSQPSYDDRSIALSWGSRRIFEGMGIWPDIAPNATPIATIHVSDRGRFGVTRLSCEEQHVDALGYVVISRDIGQILADCVDKLPNVELICPAQLDGVELRRDAAFAHITRDGQHTVLSAGLLIAADGGHSFVRKALGIKTTIWDYGQSAVIANITPERFHNNVAFERFTNSGPLAVLPLSEDRCGVVWTRRNEDVAATLALDDAEFLLHLQEQFGYRLGRFLKVGKRHAYPLRLIRAKDQVRPRLALIGNAAHALHPIAGQGFNLGLRDVAALAQTLYQAKRDGEDVGNLAVLKNYAAWRQRDHMRVTAFTDTLVRVFSNSFFPLEVARNMGMVAAEIVPPIKHTLARQAMGLVGRLPRLARGLPLE